MGEAVLRARLEAAETGARMAGRAALVAIWPARREAETRRAAIVLVGGGGDGMGCWTLELGSFWWKMDGGESSAEEEKQEKGEEEKGREGKRTGWREREKAGAPLGKRAASPGVCVYGNDHEAG